jgi:hypothetical protein
LCHLRRDDYGGKDGEAGRWTASLYSLFAKRGFKTEYLMDNPFLNTTDNPWHMFIDLFKTRLSERQGRYF